MHTTAIEQQYLDHVAKDREQRLKWFKEARFGMFITWGLHSQLGRHEWAMNREGIPIEEYEKLASTWQVKKDFAGEWARLAKKAGMKYMVLTTKHHEGFCLWDTQQTEFNSVKMSPQRDLVREFVEAAREEGLKVGLYYSLMDWHHPDGTRCAREEAARERFTDFTRGCVRELLSNYGRIDLLWYDIPVPLPTPQAWDSFRMNAMARELQPHILINDRSRLPEDFGTPEEHIVVAGKGRAWEACMTFNGSWGWQQTPPEDWHSARKVIDMLRTCTGGGGNLLLNIGPHADGSVPKEAVERLTSVGRWLKKNGGAVYGEVDRVSTLKSQLGNWTRKGNTVYFWCSRWPGEELAIAALDSKLLSARLYPNGEPLDFEQTFSRLRIKGLPKQSPDPEVQVAILELEFRSPPRQYANFTLVMPDFEPADLSGPEVIPLVTDWRTSGPQPMPQGGIAAANLEMIPSSENWKPVTADESGFISIVGDEQGSAMHELDHSADRLVYLALQLPVPDAGEWLLHLGHDGGIRVFIDGEPVFCASDLFNPCIPGRSTITRQFTQGIHELVVALDTCNGLGWGIFAHLEPAS